MYSSLQHVQCDFSPSILKFGFIMDQEPRGYLFGQSVWEISRGMNQNDGPHSTENAPSWTLHVTASSVASTLAARHEVTCHNVIDWDPFSSTTWRLLTGSSIHMALISKTSHDVGFFSFPFFSRLINTEILPLFSFYFIYICDSERTSWLCY